MKRKLIIHFIINLLSILFTFSQNIDPLKKEVQNLPFTTPKEVRLNPDTLQHLIQLIGDLEQKDFRGLVVIKDEHIAVEEYFNTYWRETIHDIRSAGKSITGLLVGIAIDKGFVKDVNQKIVDFFPEEAKKLPANDPKRQITIQHLLTMSSGLDADAYNVNSKGNEQYLLASDDWVEFALNLPMIFESGAQYTYNSVCAMLVGAIIEKASSQKLEDFALAYLFQPLGIQEYYWYTGPRNRNAGMGNLYISTLDFAKLGLLVLNKGFWNEEAIISERWINEMLTRRFTIADQDPFADGYGYLWYEAVREIDGHSYTFWFAAGNGGNHLYVIPELNMVVSLTSSAYGPGNGAFRSQNIFQYVLEGVE